MSGRCVAGAIPKGVVKKRCDRCMEMNQDWEDWLFAIMHRHWKVAGQDGKIPRVSLQEGLRSVAAFLDRAGRFLANSVSLADTEDKKAKMEGKLRAALQPLWRGAVPQAITVRTEEKKKAAAGHDQKKGRLDRHVGPRAATPGR